MRQTANDLILRTLAESPVWLAVHEFNIEGVSQNNIASRLPEFAKQGRVLGRKRGGFRYKEWRYVEPQEIA
jgi:hypothetical protein